MKISQAVRQGAIHGAIVWGAYAAAEIADTTLRPLLMNYRELTPPVVWKFTFLLLAIYLLAGALLGGLASLVFAVGRAETPSAGIPLRAPDARWECGERSSAPPADRRRAVSGRGTV